MANLWTPEASKLLLDTNVLVWWVAGSSRLSLSARRTIQGAHAVYISAATAWEIATKAHQGKLEFDGDLLEEIKASGFQPLAIHIGHAIAAAILPMHHRDPFDRMLVAQAQMESLTLVTADRHLKSYNVDVLLI